MAGPRWVKLDVDYFGNPKVLAAGRDGRDLHLASICWVARYLTDGVIPGGALEELARNAGFPARARADAIDHTIAAGLWIPLGNEFVLKDYVHMNGTRADTERDRERARQRKARYNSKRNGHSDDDA